MAEPNRLENAERRYGIYYYGLIASCIIALLTLLIVILWLTDQLYYNAWLIFLVALFIVVCVASLFFVELQRYKAARRREQSAHEWVRRTFQDQHRTYPATPSNGNKPPSSAWDKWNPLKKNNRSTSPSRYETM